MNNFAFVDNGWLYCIGQLIPTVFVRSEQCKKFNLEPVLPYDFVFRRELTGGLIVKPTWWCEDATGVRVPIHLPIHQKITE